MNFMPRILMPVLFLFFVAIATYSYIEGRAVDQKHQQNIIHRYIS